LPEIICHDSVVSGRVGSCTHSESPSTPWAIKTHKKAELQNNYSFLTACEYQNMMKSQHQIRGGIRLA